MARKPTTDGFTEMFGQFGRDLKMPSVDVEAILEHHRKNFEALQKSAAASASGATTVLAKQKAILEASMQEITEMARSLQTPGTPQDVMTRQAQFARRAFETAVANASDVASLVNKSGTESVEILRARIREAMDEIRSAYDKKS